MGTNGDQDSGDDSEAVWRRRSDRGALETALEETRRSYDKDIDSINEVDEKAMRAARTGFLVLGITVSGLAVFGSGTLGGLSIEVKTLGGFGLGLVFTSTLFALGTYTATEYPTGIGREHRKAAINDGYTHAEWLEFMIEEYGDWTGEVNEMAGANAQYLENTVFIQAVGLLSLFLAVVVGYLNQVEGVSPLKSLVTVLLFLVATLLSGALVFLVRNIADTLLEKRP